MKAKYAQGYVEDVRVIYVLCGLCLAPMTAEVGLAFPTGGEWVWWRCDAGHVTEAIPRPPR